MENAMGRKYYHAGREPKVLIQVNDSFYTGLVSDFWKKGLNININALVHFKQNDRISRLYFDSLGQEHIIEGMLILRSHPDEETGRTHIAIQAPDAETEDRFKKVFHLLWGGKGKDKSASPESRSIPRFVGSEHYSGAAVEARLDWARKVSGSRLEAMGSSIHKPETLAGNIENYIGSVQIPIGLAGPILINGVYANGHIPVPIATTEGALVSSITRGARVCALAGGIDTKVIEQNMQRVPAFFCEDQHGALNLERWVMGNTEKIRAKAESVSSVARIKHIIPTVYGNALHLNFTFTTGDAAGQNMTTSCTWVACEWMDEQIRDNPSFKYISYCLEGNMSSDKKVSFQSFINGRGISVMASCFIPARLYREKLNCDHRKFAELYHEAEFSAQRLGMIGVNINFANPIAGIFAATGQDIACVHESSVGILKVRCTDDGILVTAMLPSLVIGTVGGGTKLPTQRESLEIMNCYGEGKSFKLAEIIAAACLSLDISTGAALTANEFASAHDRMGRNRPVRYLSKAELTPEFFTALLHDKGKSVVSAEEGVLDHGSGLVSSYIKERKKKFQGLLKYSLKVKAGETESDLPAVLKIKTDDTEIIDLAVGVARLSGEDRLPGMFEAQSRIFGFENSHVRELAFSKHAHPDLLKYCPRIYGTYQDKTRGASAILMEDLSPCSHLDTINDPSLWDEASIKTVLGDMAGVHAVYLDRTGDIPPGMHMDQLTEKKLAPAVNLLMELTGYNARRFPAMVPRPLEKLYLSFLENVPVYLREMQAFPLTLAHNDFTVRNVCLRRGDDPGRPRLVLYDWELACCKNPQVDLVEFLVNCLPDQMSMTVFDSCAAFYRARLEEAAGRTFDKEEFMRVTYLNALLHGVIRFNLYLLLHNVMKLSFIERVYGNLQAYLLGNAGKHGILKLSSLR